MSSFYRVRALVDGCREECVCLGTSPDGAMSAFETVTAQDTGEPFGSYGIHVAMIHRITFGETGPLFEDVTPRLSQQWARSSYEEAISYYNESAQAGNTKALPEHVE